MDRHSERFSEAGRTGNEAFSASWLMHLLGCPGSARASDRACERGRVPGRYPPAARRSRCDPARTGGARGDWNPCSETGNARDLWLAVQCWSDSLAYPLVAATLPGGVILQQWRRAPSIGGRAGIGLMHVADPKEHARLPERRGSSARMPKRFVPALKRQEGRREQKCPIVVGID